MKWIHASDLELKPVICQQLDAVSFVGDFGWGWRVQFFKKELCKKQ